MHAEKPKSYYPFGKNQSHGRDYDHGYNGCSMFVPLTRSSSSSSENSGSCNGECGNGKSGQRGAVGVTWAERDIFIGEARDTRNLSSVCPRDICVQDLLAEETSLGVRMVTLGSCAGDNDRAVCEAPKFVEAAAGK